MHNFPIQPFCFTHSNRPGSFEIMNFKSIDDLIVGAVKWLLLTSIQSLYRTWTSLPVVVERLVELAHA